MSRVRTDFSAGKRFVAVASEAIADGITAAAIQAQGLATQGMVASGSVHAVPSKRSGIAYYPGPGSPRGTYPKIRSGLLQNSLGTERARVRAGGRVTGFFTASAPYAFFVHGSESRPLRPYLTLPFQRNRTHIMRAFTRVARRRLA